MSPPETWNRRRRRAEARNNRAKGKGRGGRAYPPEEPSIFPEGFSSPTLTNEERIRRITALLMEAAPQTGPAILDYVKDNPWCPGSTSPERSEEPEAVRGWCKNVKQLVRHLQRRDTQTRAWSAEAQSSDPIPMNRIHPSLHSPEAHRVISPVANPSGSSNVIQEASLPDIAMRHGLRLHNGEHPFFRRAGSPRWTGEAFRHRTEERRACRAAHSIAAYFRWPLAAPHLLGEAAHQPLSNIQTRRGDPILRMAFTMLQFEVDALLSARGNTAACLACGLYTASYCDTCKRALCTACCQARGTKEFSECQYCGPGLVKSKRATAPDLLPPAMWRMEVGPARFYTDGKTTSVGQLATPTKAVAPTRCSHCGGHPPRPPDMRGGDAPSEGAASSDGALAVAALTVSAKWDTAEQWPQDATRDKWRRCSCKRASYCSPECQKRHWPIHRTWPCTRMAPQDVPRRPPGYPMGTEDYERAFHNTERTYLGPVFATGQTVSTQQHERGEEEPPPGQWGRPQDFPLLLEPGLTQEELEALYQQCLEGSSDSDGSSSWEIGPIGAASSGTSTAAEVSRARFPSGQFPNA